MNDQDLSMQDETVVITGASSGIGAACATLFSDRGARVVLIGRSLTRLQNLRDQLKGPAICLEVDVRERDSVAAGFATLPKPFSAPTVLINSAGVAIGREPLQSGDPAEWEDVIRTNVNGVMNCLAQVLPGMTARNRGHVFNIGSIGGVYPQPGVGVYGGSKAFLHQITLNLRADLAGTGVRATIIEPGTTQTGFHRVRFRGDIERAEAVYAGFQPLTAMNVADCVLWCFGQPPHVNINIVELMPTMMTYGQFVIHRSPVD